MHVAADNPPDDPRISRTDKSLEHRLFIGMQWTVGLAVLICAPIAPWRITTGVLLGGLLSILNYYWLRASLVTLFESAGTEVKRKTSLARYILRYMVLSVIVMAAYSMKFVSLPATIAGLCSVVVPVMIESGRLFYNAVFHREGS